MKILKITADRDSLIFRTDCDGIFEIKEYTPVTETRLLKEEKAESKNGTAMIVRFEGDRDRLLSRFETDCGGVCFVTDFEKGVPAADYPYPQPETIKALGGADEEDIKTLGVHQTLLNISLTALMSTVKNDDTEVYLYNGREYYIYKDAIEQNDRIITRAWKNGQLTTLILLNSPEQFGSKKEQALWDIALHPRYDWQARDAFLSAFDAVREEGNGYFCAFIDFLMRRYTRSDAKYGRIGGAIVSNEVDSSSVWNNCGETDVDTMTDEYCRTMREVWLLGRKYYASFRVYMSLDQFFYARYRPLEPLHTYKGRDIIDKVNAYGKQQGDFGWAIAYHPYPEDLRCPDFWNDRAPDFTFTTPKITFKNMEVLPDYLSREELLYEGAPRRIIFSEQGFNSQSGVLRDLTEEQAAAAYCLAYIKARNIPTVDLFTHHAYIDNPHEFGLNLGIRRFDESKPDHHGEPKPVYYAMADMDTEREKARIARARAFIGETLFDYLLDPPLTHGDGDNASEIDFGD